MSLSQNDLGRAFEYGIVVAMSNIIPAEIIENAQLENSKRCFESCSDIEKRKIVKASSEATAFLVAHDREFSDARGFTIQIQTDQMGGQGDVRDIIIRNKSTGKETGISAKNRHFAIKHSRLSEQIDFGDEWFGVPCSNEYFQTIVPAFRELRTLHRQGEKWRNIPDKKQRFYMPILQAFESEMRRLFSQDPQKTAHGLIQYLLGRYDYYKVIKENGQISILSFNIYNTLGWGSKLSLPDNLIQIDLKPRSETTLFMIFDKGWQISFRIHNASSVVEPSLKFDIQPVGFPSTMSRNIIDYETNG